MSTKATKKTVTKPAEVTATKEPRYKGVLATPATKEALTKLRGRCGVSEAVLITAIFGAAVGTKAQEDKLVEQLSKSVADAEANKIAKRKESYTKLLEAGKAKRAEARTIRDTAKAEAKAAAEASEKAANVKANATDKAKSAKAPAKVGK